MGDMLATDTEISAGSGGVGTAAQAEAVTHAVQVAKRRPWIERCCSGNPSIGSASLRGDGCGSPNDHVVIS